MRFYRYSVTMKAAFNRDELRYSKGYTRRYPFLWLARLRAWVWLTLNFFPGELRAIVSPLPTPPLER